MVQKKDNLILFIKYPRIHEVKTRLAKDLGAEKACDFYRFCVESITREMKKVRGNKFIFVSKESDINSAKEWLGEEFKYFSQEEGDLTARLLGTSSLFSKDSKTLIFGSDIPDLKAEIINKAFKSLEQSDIVLGPCPDGGYYLIGSKDFYPTLFQNISWSTDQVLKQTIKAAESLQLKYDLLSPLRDIDTIEDFQLWSSQHLTTSTSLKSPQMSFLTSPL